LVPVSRSVSIVIVIAAAVVAATQTIRQVQHRPTETRAGRPATEWSSPPRRRDGRRRLIAELTEVDLGMQDCQTARTIWGYANIMTVTCELSVWRASEWITDWLTDWLTERVSYRRIIAYKSACSIPRRPPWTTFGCSVWRLQTLVWRDVNQPSTLQSICQYIRSMSSKRIVQGLDRIYVYIYIYIWRQWTLESDDNKSERIEKANATERAMIGDNVARRNVENDVPISVQRTLIAIINRFTTRRL